MPFFVIATVWGFATFGRTMPWRRNGKKAFPQTFLLMMFPCVGEAFAAEIVGLLYVFELNFLPDDTAAALIGTVHAHCISRG